MCDRTARRTTTLSSIRAAPAVASRRTRKTTSRESSATARSSLTRRSLSPSKPYTAKQGARCAGRLRDRTGRVPRECSSGAERYVLAVDGRDLGAIRTLPCRLGMEALAARRGRAVVAAGAAGAAMPRRPQAGAPNPPPALRVRSGIFACGRQRRRAAPAPMS